MKNARWRLTLATGLAFASAPLVWSDVTLDGSINPGTEDVSTWNGALYDLTEALGRVHGDNLFHSFDSFSIEAGRTAVFSGSASLQNIIARVTGGDISEIGGTIQSSLSADLWILNPAGFVFQSGAVLDLNGSFHIATADEISGEDGSFEVSNPPPSIDDSTLFISSPTEFGFLGSSAGAISVQTSLAVDAGRDLSLIAADRVEMSDAEILAPGGTVRLAAVQSGTVSIGPEGLTLTDPVMDASNLVHIDQQSTIDVSTSSGTAGGSVYIRGGAFQLGAFGGDISTTGVIDAHVVDGDAGEVDIEVAGRAELRGGEILAGTTGTGNGGQISIRAGDFNYFAQLSQIDISTSAAGNGGSLLIQAEDRVELAADIDASADPGASGDAGDITILAGGDIIFESSEGASLNARNRGAGTGGDISLSAGGTVNAGDNVTLDGSAYNGSGAITVSGTDIIFEGLFDTKTLGAGDGGSITVAATNALEIRSGILDSSALAGSTGNAGDIGISGAGITLTVPIDNRPADINADSLGTGNGGNIDVVAGTLRMIGDANDPVRISTASRGLNSGQAGDINIELTGSPDTDLVMEYAHISSATEGMGDAGRISIHAAGAVIDPVDVSLRLDSRINASTSHDGDAGGIAMDITGDLTIFGAPDGGLTGQSGIFSASLSDTATAGSAGTIDISARNISLLDELDYGGVEEDTGGVIRATTEGNNPFASPGSIDISTTGTFLIDGSNSGVFSSTHGAANAGAITIRDGTLLLNSAGFIQAATFADGDAGTVTFRDMAMLSIEGTASSSTSGVGAGGGVFVVGATDVNVIGGQIVTSTSAAGPAGPVTFDLDGDIVLVGADAIVSTSTDSSEFGGPAGSVEIRANNLLLQDASINAITQSNQAGNTAANIDIDIANELRITGAGSGLFTSTSGASPAGSISITGGSLLLMHDALLQASTSADGAAGSVLLNDIGSVRIFGTLSSSTTANGNAGGILIAGLSDVQIDGGTLQVSTSGSGTAGRVAIDVDGDVEVLNGALLSSTSLNASAGPAGSIAIAGRNLRLAESLVSATTASNVIPDPLVQAPANVSLSAVDTLRLQSNSEILAGTTAAAPAGAVTLSATSLVVEQGASIAASTLASGNAGIVALTGTDSITIAGIVSSSTGGTGAAGGINISAPVIDLTGGTLSATTTQTGAGGSIAVSSDDFLTISSGSRLDASTSGAGDAGNVVFDVGGVVDLQAGAIVQSASTGVASGAPGTITIRGGALADIAGAISTSSEGAFGDGAIEISGFERVAISGAVTSNTTGSGHGGIIDFSSLNFRQSASGLISASTSGAGPAGSINVQVADTFALEPGARIESASIGSAAGAPGDISIIGGITADLAGIINTSSEGAVGEGAITISGFEETLFNGAVSSSTAGAGDGGTVNIDSARLTIGGHISAGSNAEGRGGDVILSASEMILNGAVVSAEATGAGFAGSIIINATDALTLENRALINASSLLSGGGEIFVDVGDYFRLDDADIVASSGGANLAGGSITIGRTFAPLFFIVTDSRILASGGANAAAGNINLFANHLFIDERSVIRATNQLNINTNITDLTGAITDVEIPVLDVVDLLNNRCAMEALRERSSFIVEEERLPPSPDDQAATTNPGWESSRMANRGEAIAPSFAGAMPKLALAGCP